jgi:endogenous inhibitor of DNA gyrase (YacG/DUF329 family)
MGVRKKPKWAKVQDVINRRWKWSCKEDNFVRQHAGKQSAIWMASVLGRTPQAIRDRADDHLGLSLRYDQYRWSGQEKQFLTQNAGKKSVYQIAHEMNRSPKAVAAMARRLKLCLTLDKKECAVCGKGFKRKHNNSRTVCSSKCRRVRQSKWAKKQTEYRTVHAHYVWIFRKDGTHRTYKGMPFFDGWNPKKGGSFRAGANWILENLGRRPKGTTLHIIDHEKGFTPNNLEWTHPRKQSNQQMFKIIAQQRHRIKELEAEVALLKAA